MPKAAIVSEPTLLLTAYFTTYCLLYCLLLTAYFTALQLYREPTVLPTLLHAAYCQLPTATAGCWLLATDYRYLLRVYLLLATCCVPAIASTIPTSLDGDWEANIRTR